MAVALTRRAALAGAALALGATSRVFAQLTQRGPSSDDAVTPDSIDRRLEDQAAALKREAPQGADRHVLFDLTFPADPAEYRAVGKSAVILIVAVSQRAEELPLRRVYTRAGGRDVEVRKLGARVSQTKPSSLARAVFGGARMDGFYLAPVGPLLRENLLLCDFAKNRIGFFINRAPFDPPDYIVSDRERDAAAKPQEAAVRAMVEREYPGFDLLGH